MKKIYSLALAAAVAISASAATELSSVNRNFESKGISKKMPVNNSWLNNTVKTMDVEEGDLSIENLEGEYDWTYYNFLNGASGGWKKGVLGIIVDDASKGEVTVDLAGWEVKGSYDASNGKLTIETGQDLGYNEYNKIQVYLYHDLLNADLSFADDYVDTPFEITFDGSALNFASVEGTGEAEGMTVYVDVFAIGNDAKGWFLYAGMNEATKRAPFVEEMPAGEWTSIGKGLFTDGWQTIAYVGATDYAEELYQWEVDVEQNSINPSLYRIHNPYNTEDYPFYDYNLDKEGTGNIVFSVEDPEFVVAYPNIYSGLTKSNGAFLNFNVEGYWSILGGYDKETIIAAGVLEEGVSNYADGKVTFYNCVFATTDEYDALYNWVDKEGNSLVGPSYLEIELPHAGVDVITINDNNAPVEYYNLQGIRVAEPANGLYIVRQGNKVSKVVK